MLNNILKECHSICKVRKAAKDLDYSTSSNFFAKNNDW
uniref:Uncharacterized protein n=1 Tax=Romanomermis culicivorax TaxID=13658 RepID=A0A915JW14_ROMCU